MVLVQPPAVETLLPLTRDELRRLKECERVIERGLATFYEVGNALAEIRESQLYRISYATFEDYCREKWDMSRFYAHRLIDAAQVVENLLPIGNIPLNEAQARELSPYEAEVQKAVWHVALNTAPTNGEGKPLVTASHIRSVANVLTEVVKGGGLDDGSGNIKPLGVLIDAAVTEETYERMMRQKEHIKERSWQDKEERAKRDVEDTSGVEVDLSPEVKALLDRYMAALTEFEEAVPPDAGYLRLMFQTHKAQAHWQKKRVVEDDCDVIVRTVKKTGDGAKGDIDANHLYEWLLDLGYFMSRAQFIARLEYMNQDDIRRALLTDAGEGKQEERRGKLPWIVCVPWRKVWNQGAKRDRDEDDEE
jgi:hypothetical protein